MANYYQCNLSIFCENAKVIEEIMVAVKRHGKVSAVGSWLRQLRRFKLLKSENDKVLLGAGLLEYLAPMPSALSETVTNGWQGKEPEWRKWRTEHWGCSYGVGIDKLNQVDAHTLTMTFWAHSAVPLPALLIGASRLHFTFKISYWDSGNELVGVATEKSCNEYVLADDKPPIAAGVPQALIDEFDLDRFYRENER